MRAAAWGLKFPKSKLGREFPSSAAEWTARYSEIPTPTAIYNMQETTGGLIDRVGTVNLAYVESTASVVNPTYSYAEPATRADPLGRTGIKMNAAASSFQVPSATNAHQIFQMTTVTDQIAGWIRCGGNIHKNVTSYAGRRLISHKTRLTAEKGWDIYFDDVTGKLTLRVANGTTPIIAQVGTDHADGVWYDVFWAIQRAPNHRMRLVTDEGDSGWVDIASLGTANDAFAAVTRFTIGCANIVDTMVGAYSYACLWENIEIDPSAVSAIITAA